MLEALLINSLRNSLPKQNHSDIMKHKQQAVKIEHFNAIHISNSHGISRWSWIEFRFLFPTNKISWKLPVLFSFAYCKSASVIIGNAANAFFKQNKANSMEQLSFPLFIADFFADVDVLQFPRINLWWKPLPIDCETHFNFSSNLKISSLDER